MLIRIGKTEIIDHTIIARAHRNGNYTDIQWKNEKTMSQIWDENEDIWYAIIRATEAELKK